MTGQLRRTIFIVSLLFVFAAACKGKNVVGIPAVDFSLNRIDRGKIAYSDLKGKPLILYFFASW